MEGTEAYKAGRAMGRMQAEKENAEELARLRAENETLRCIAWLFGNSRDGLFGSSPFLRHNNHKLVWECMTDKDRAGFTVTKLPKGWMPTDPMPRAILAEVLPAFRAWEQEQRKEKDA